MADNFEKAKDEILKRTASNGGPTPLDLLNALGALADDQDAQHAESIATMKENRRLFDAHLVEAEVYDERITVLEEWRHEAATTCEERVRALIDREHADRHAAYVSSLAPDTFNTKLIWFFATATGKIFLVLIGAGAALLFNFLLYGRP